MFGMSDTLLDRYEAEQPEQLNRLAAEVEVPGNNCEVRDSVLGRLLMELSWVGCNIRDVRNGGLGLENVLTAEALTALDFLPRTDFPGRAPSAGSGPPHQHEVCIWAGAVERA